MSTGWAPLRFIHKEKSYGLVAICDDDDDEECKKLLINYPAGQQSGKTDYCL